MNTDAGTLNTVRENRSKQWITKVTQNDQESLFQGGRKGSIFENQSM